MIYKNTKRREALAKAYYCERLSITQKGSGILGYGGECISVRPLSWYHLLKWKWKIMPDNGQKIR